MKGVLIAERPDGFGERSADLLETATLRWHRDGPGAAQFSDRIAVVARFGDGLVEDRRVGGHAPLSLLLHLVLGLAGGEKKATDAVVPDALTEVESRVGSERSWLSPLSFELVLLSELWATGVSHLVRGEAELGGRQAQWPTWMPRVGSPPSFHGDGARMLSTQIVSITFDGRGRVVIVVLLSRPAVLRRRPP